MEYKWTCSACNSSNEAKSDHCPSCGCPAIADGWLIRGWKKSIEGHPEKPTLNAMNISLWGEMGILFHKTSPCPTCSMQMYIYQGKCPHCLYKLALNERYSLIEYYKVAQRYGRTLGLIFFPIFILIATLLHHIITN